MRQAAAQKTQASKLHIHEAEEVGNIGNWAGKQEHQGNHAAVRSTNVPYLIRLGFILDAEQQSRYFY